MVDCILEGVNRQVQDKEDHDNDENNATSNDATDCAA